jgi:hypothetical protein
MGEFLSQLFGSLEIFLVKQVLGGFLGKRV